MSNIEENFEQSPEMFEYEVNLFEKDSLKQVVFNCFAENGVHAMEKAKVAYPGCRILIASRKCVYAIVPPTKS